MSENDCPHCGQDLRLAPDAWDELLRLKAKLGAMKQVKQAAQAVIDDWPNTMYGDDDPGFKHWIMLMRLRDVLAAQQE